MAYGASEVVKRLARMSKAGLPQHVIAQSLSIELQVPVESEVVQRYLASQDNLDEIQSLMDTKWERMEGMGFPKEQLKVLRVCGEEVVRKW